MKATFTRKPKKCPECGSHKIAGYLYGTPAFSPVLEKRIEDGKIALGRFVITVDAPMPKWSVLIAGQTSSSKSSLHETLDLRDKDWNSLHRPWLFSQRSRPTCRLPSSSARNRNTAQRYLPNSTPP